MGWLAVPRDWLAAFGEIARFCGRVAGLVYSGRVLTFFGESLRQAGILSAGSAVVIWGTVFILDLQCGLGLGRSDRLGLRSDDRDSLGLGGRRRLALRFRARWTCHSGAPDSGATRRLPL